MDNNWRGRSKPGGWIAGSDTMVWLVTLLMISEPQDLAFKVKCHLTLFCVMFETVLDEIKQLLTLYMYHLSVT